MKYFEGRIPIKSWCNEPETGAIEQAIHVASLPFAFRHVPLMPDTHQGYGMPIGCILASEGYIVPNAVGVDIGCGMLAVETNIKYENIKDSLKTILGDIRKVIPVGFNKHNTSQESLHLFVFSFLTALQKENAEKSLGTLGGGNHFIEIQKDENDSIWIMIHSGSRNLGKTVCDHYNEIAIEVNEKNYSVVPKTWQLAFLRLDSEEGTKYYKDMVLCINFAKANRRLMMDRVLNIVKPIVAGIKFGNGIDVCHNYARMEHHFGRDVMIHRKGAISARDGELGIIPGSQGTYSYIVKGKGNIESFTSCSHGSGRKMSRTAAEKNLNLEEEQERLNKIGVLHSIRGVKDLDEAAGAYKDINIVMQESSNLVDVVTELRPIAVVKG